MSDTLDLAVELIARESVTPRDAGCQQLLIERLERIGFHCQSLPFGDVSNLWARRGDSEPLFVFAGHTDVVPAGPLKHWTYPPFEATLCDGILYGRGAADMKGSIAAMVIATQRFLDANPAHHGSIAFLITSDEEGPAVDGTVRVVDHLTRRGQSIDWCLVGEPSCVQTLGDMIKIGRRGSLSAELTIHGIQGHVAYPQSAENPIHRWAPALTELVNKRWDDGNRDFPPTTFQVSNIHAGTGVSNVIPGELSASFNFRFSTAVSVEILRNTTEQILRAHDLRFDCEWSLSGQPFLTRRGVLSDAVGAAINAETGVDTTCSTQGGTSDGRFIAPTGAQVVELGPVNKSIHKVDEHVVVADLDRLTNIYRAVLERLLKLN